VGPPKKVRGVQFIFFVYLTPQRGRGCFLSVSTGRFVCRFSLLAETYPKPTPHVFYWPPTGGGGAEPPISGPLVTVCFFLGPGLVYLRGPGAHGVWGRLRPRAEFLLGRPPSPPPSARAFLSGAFHKLICEPLGFFWAPHPKFTNFPMFGLEEGAKTKLCPTVVLVFGGRGLFCWGRRGGGSKSRCFNH